MKKLLILVLILAIVLIVITVSACSNNSTASYSRSKVTSFNRQKSSSQSTSFVFPFFSSSVSSSSEMSGEHPASRRESIYESSSKSYLTDPVEIVEAIINGIGEVNSENYLTREQLIIFAEQKYLELTANQKIAVSNYQTLIDARSIFDNFSQSDANIAITAFLDTFAVIGEYEFSQVYKTKLDNAFSLYQAIPNSYASTVDSEFTQLNQLLNKFSDEETVSNLQLLYDELPNHIEDSSLGLFRTVINAFDNLTQSQLNLLSTTTEDGINYLKTVICEAYSQKYVWKINNEQNGIFNISSTLLATTDNASEQVRYNGETLSEGKVIKTDSAISIAIPYSGYLKLYASTQQGTTATLNVYKGSKKICELKSNSSNEIDLFLSEIGSYSIEVEKQDLLLFACEFH